MINRKITRRQAIATASAGTLGALTTLPFTSFSFNNSKTLALHGGNKVRTADWPEWPIWDTSAEKDITEMLRSGRWWRGSGEHVADFERKYADLMGTKRCLATASGTTALLVATHVLGVDAGDEVLVSPYTFIATYNVILSMLLGSRSDMDDIINAITKIYENRRSLV